MNVVAGTLPADSKTIEETGEPPLADIAEAAADPLDRVEGPTGALDAKQPRFTPNDVEDRDLGLLSTLMLRGKKRACARDLA